MIVPTASAEIPACDPGRMAPVLRLGLISQFSSLVGRLDLAIGALMLFTIGREFGLRREIIVGQRFGHRRMGESVTAALTDQNPARHRPDLQPTAFVSDYPTERQSGFSCISSLLRRLLPH
jgi:hypothetical protein